MNFLFYATSAMARPLSLIEEGEVDTSPEEAAWACYASIKNTSRNKTETFRIAGDRLPVPTRDVWAASGLSSTYCPPQHKAGPLLIGTGYSRQWMIDGCKDGAPYSIGISTVSSIGESAGQIITFLYDWLDSPHCPEEDSSFSPLMMLACAVGVIIAIAMVAKLIAQYVNSNQSAADTRLIFSV